MGQVLETNIGWAGRELGQQINEFMERELSPKALKAKLKDIYDSSETKKLIDNLDDEEVIEVAKRLGNGIPLKLESKVISQGFSHSLIAINIEIEKTIDEKVFQVPEKIKLREITNDELGFLPILK